MGCLESPGVDGKDSSGCCTFSNRYLTPGKLGQAFLRSDLRAEDLKNELKLMGGVRGGYSGYWEQHVKNLT